MNIQSRNQSDGDGVCHPLHAVGGTKFAGHLAGESPETIPQEMRGLRESAVEQLAALSGFAIPANQLRGREWREEPWSSHGCSDSTFVLILPNLACASHEAQALLFGGG